jgi:hypothetical protein
MPDSDPTPDLIIKTRLDEIGKVCFFAEDNWFSGFILFLL